MVTQYSVMDFQTLLFSELSHRQQKCEHISYDVVQYVNHISAQQKSLLLEKRSVIIQAVHIHYMIQ